MAGTTTLVHEIDGTTTEYDEVRVDGDRIETLLRELLADHWPGLTMGPLIQGAAWEIRFAARPALSMMDGYMTIDTGAWHFHLCVNDTSGSAEMARARRVARAAFFRTVGGSCSPEVYGLRLWNGLGEQMTTVLFPSPFYDDAMNPLPRPDHSRTEVWETFRRRYT